MCLIAFAWRPDAEHPLVVAANRDEFHARPTDPLDWWDDVPDVAAGRDRQAGGTWMGVTRSGRFAALTNFRDMQQTEAGAPSRGLLVADFLTGTASAAAYAANIDARRYAGYSLLLFDGDELVFATNRADGEAGVSDAVAPGVHALSNGALDSRWPKVQRAREALAAQVQAGPDTTALLELMDDRTPAEDAALPDTGVGLTLERFLSPMFIDGADYGTRASTALVLGCDQIAVAERRFGPHGEAIGDSELRFAPTGWANASPTAAAG